MLERISLLKRSQLDTTCWAEFICWSKIPGPLVSWQEIYLKGKFLGLSSSFNVQKHQSFLLLFFSLGLIIWWLIVFPIIFVQMRAFLLHAVRTLCIFFKVYFTACQRFCFIYNLPVRLYLLREAAPANESVVFHQWLWDKFLSDLLNLHFHFKHWHSSGVVETHKVRWEQNGHPRMHLITLVYEKTLLVLKNFNFQTYNN